MLRSAIARALKDELKKGLSVAIAKEARKNNPNQNVSLGSIKGQVDKVHDLLLETQESITVTFAAIKELTYMLDEANEISPDFISKAVESYVEDQVL